MKKIKLINAHLVTEEGIIKKDILIHNGLIDLTAAKEDCEQTIDLSGKYILPGFVDTHFHGYNLFDFTMGQFIPESNRFDDSENAYKQGLETLCKNLTCFGVTGFYIATVAASLEKLKKCYNHLAQFQQKNQKPHGARLFGGLLEGSFINPKMCGAQNREHIFEFTGQAFDRIEDKGPIKLANVVPDFDKSSTDLTEYLTKKGIVVGAGHTDGTSDQFYEAIKAGLKYCIHFTNGPTGKSFKPFHGGGALEAGLKYDQLYAELITDGYHINPAYIRDIIKRKGIEKIIGITDCMFVAGSHLKNFNLNGIRGEISKDSKYIALEGKDNILYGSNLTMDKGFENMLNWLSSEIPGIWNATHQALNFEQTLTAASKMFSTNPCKLTGLIDKGFGRISNKAKADLCVLDITGQAGNYKTNVELTIVDGDIVYSKNQKGL